MNNSVVGTICFVLGAAVGGAVVWKYLDEKYKERSDAEINSVKERFTVPRRFSNKSEEDVLNAASNKPSLTDIAKGKEFINKDIFKRYTNYSNIKDEEPKKEDEDSKPRVISPDEFGDEALYDQISLTLYADGILANDDDEIVDDGCIGDALEHMGEYEDDAVHVCNPKRMAYYEILADNRSYEAATGKKPSGDDKED